MAEEKKSHARETAGHHMGGLNFAQIQRATSNAQQQNHGSGNRMAASQTPDHEMSGSSHGQHDADHEFGTPSSQGQGESYRDSSLHLGPGESRSQRME